MKAHRTAKIAAKRRTRGKPFKPGEDPRRNKGGRPQAKEANRLIAEIWDEVVRGGQTRGEVLLRSLFALAADKNKMVRLSAIKEVLDRRLGKPTQAVEMHSDMITIGPAPDYSRLSEVELKTMFELARKAATPPAEAEDSE